MDRKSLAALALTTLIVTSSLAQDSSLNLTADLSSQVQRRFSEKTFQARVDRMPSNYLASEARVHIVENEKATTSRQNLLILCCFATLLTAGGIITAVSVNKRRKNARRVNVAPPVKICV